MLNVGGVAQQQSHDLAVTLPAGQGQGDVVLAAGGNVDLCTLLQEQLRHSQMALSGGEGGREGGWEGGR